MTRLARKQTLKSLSLSYPIQMAGAPPILLWVWHRLQNIIYEVSRVIFYSRCHTQRRIGGPQPFVLGMTMTLDLKVCFLVTRIKLQRVKDIRFYADKQNDAIQWNYSNLIKKSGFHFFNTVHHCSFVSHSLWYTAEYMSRIIL